MLAGLAFPRPSRAILAKLPEPKRACRWKARVFGSNGWRTMKRLGSAAVGLLLAFQAAASARGVTPYLPLNLEPEIEAQIERVLILAGKPVMRRPIAAATVLEALPKACAVDARLCEQVGRYLSRYMHKSD